MNSLEQQILTILTASVFGYILGSLSSIKRKLNEIINKLNKQ